MNTRLFSLLAMMCLLTACGSNESAVTAESAEPQPATEAAEAEADHVELTDDQIKAADIGLATAGPAKIREALPLYGVISPNAERTRDVAARFPGSIRSVTRQIGDSVREGEPMATVESNESLQTYPVIAPLSGVVTARNANPGEQTSDRVLFTVADLSTVWVELSVFPRDLAKVRVGQMVLVRSADTGRSAQGKVIYVAAFGTSSNQTLLARVLLNNGDRLWAPGLYVTAEVTLTETAVPLAISSEALQTLEEATVVFVKSDEGFEPRPMQLGRSDGLVTEVVSGIKPGETYATRNSFILKAELSKGETEHGH